jgi:hypothetical protein
VEALRRELVQSNFYDFPFYGGTRVHHCGWIVAGVFLDLWSRGSFLLDNLTFPACVEFIVLDDSLQNNVLLPFLSHSSQGCTLDFSADVLSGREGMEKLFSDISSLIINWHVIICAPETRRD